MPGLCLVQTGTQTSDGRPIYIILPHDGSSGTGGGSSNGYYPANSDTAAAPSFTWVADADTGLYQPAAGVIAFTQNGSETVRLTSAGNLGINTNTPTQKLHVVGSAIITGNLTVDNLTATTFNNLPTVTDTPNLTVGDASNGTVGQPNWLRFKGTSGDGGGFHTFIADRMFQTPESSELLIFKGNDPEERIRYLSARHLFQVYTNYPNISTAELAATSSANNVVEITNGALTCYGDIVALSDARVKSDLQVISSALEKVKQLTGYTFCRQGCDKRKTGLIAQDVQAVLPEAVNQDSDATLGVAYGNLAGLFVEALKELDQRLTALEARAFKEP